MANKDAFPSTVLEQDGEIVPSYAPGNGNEPVYTNEAEALPHLEFEDVTHPTGRNHPVIRAAIERSRGSKPIGNSALGSVETYVKNREEILGGK